MREPGIYTMSAQEYHSIRAFSASIANVLLRCSPFHALNAQTAVPEESETFDIGTAAHALILEGEERFCVLDFPDWRTKAAREARDIARAEGKTPLLAHRADAVRVMAQAVRDQCDEFEEKPIPLAGGKPEQTIIWREGEALLKARLDWLHDDMKVIDDLKTTESAEPGAWGRRQLYANGCDVQAAMYIRAVKAVTGVEPVMRFVVAETSYPHAVSVVGLDPSALTCAHDKADAAIMRWRLCLRDKKWPAYPKRVAYIAAPPWEMAASVEREWDGLQELDAADKGSDA